MADREELRERVEAIYARWRPILGLDGWDVTREYEPGEFLNDDKSSGAATAVTYVSWEYRSATITFNLSKLAEAPDIEYVVLHEAMHILTNALRPVRTDHGDIGVYNAYDRLFEEHTCTTLAWAFMRAVASPVRE